jgi:hypothetical protein
MIGHRWPWRLLTQQFTSTGCARRRRSRRCWSFLTSLSRMLHLRQALSAMQRPHDTWCAAQTQLTWLLRGNRAGDYRIIWWLSVCSHDHMSSVVIASAWCSQVDTLLESIPKMFASTQVADCCAGAAIQAAIEALQVCMQNAPCSVSLRSHVSIDADVSPRHP